MPFQGHVANLLCTSGKGENDVIIRLEHLARRRSGSVAPLVALSLIPVMGIAALVIDIGVLRDERRQAVRAADAAALAGATDLFTNYSANGGKDKNGTAVKSALTTAAANGFPQNGNNSSVTVTVWPNNYQGGPLAGTQIPPGYVEVMIAFTQDRAFSRIWGDGLLNGGARAVARGTYSPAAPGILILHPTDDDALDVTGAGNLTVTGGGSIVVDSNAPGGGAKLTSTGNATANVFNLSAPAYSRYSSGDLIGTVNYNVPRTPDPLAALPEPPLQDFPTLPASTLSTSGLSYSTGTGVNYSGSSSLDLYPGRYAGINVTGSGSVVLHANSNGSPGIYYIGSQGFSMTSSGGISGSNVLLYTDGTGNISLTGSGPVNLSPPTSGIYKGIAIFQERSSDKPINVTAQGNMNVTGTLYAPSAKVTLTALGSSNNPFGSQWIAYQLVVTGSGSFTVQYAGSASPVRSIQLVE
jgi:Flp pilus assembly protein TadG